MTPLRLIRRLHAPLCCLAIACIFSVGCSTKQEVIALGKPSQAYQAGDGSVLFGYYVQPTIKPDDAGWHWLIIEPDTAERLMQPATRGGIGESEKVVGVTYKGWGRNARLVPPLLEPGLSDDSPPAAGDGALTTLRFIWDADGLGPRLVDADFATLALMRVSPDAQRLKVREYDREVMWDVVKITAVGLLIAGLIILGGDADIDFN